MRDRPDIGSTVNFRHQMVAPPALAPGQTEQVERWESTPAKVLGYQKSPGLGLTLETGTGLKLFGIVESTDPATPGWFVP